jgi:HK97 family phage prohead protease
MSPEPSPLTRVARSPGTLDEPNRLHGYAARFNEESAVLFDPKVCKGPFVEVIRPGAFARTLRENPDILALFNHDFAHVLGRTGAGTLALSEDAEGLAFEVSLPDTTVARDLRESVRRGDFAGCSFYGYVVEDTVEARAGLPALRTLVEVELVEVTPATAMPAYDSTSVVLRNRHLARD